MNAFLDIVLTEVKKLVEENPGQDVKVVIRVDDKTIKTINLSKDGDTKVGEGTGVLLWD